MIPILYSKSETQFLSNGLGRLTECISCDVTEERNGIYECEFTYPVTGRFCKEMMENGGIISVTHDNHGDRQAFDIYKFSAPIDGIVTFNAHHISYRLNGIIVTPFEASTCAGALQKISQKSANTNPFTFTTDKVVTAPYIVSVPSNARSLLGGSSGSILDTYGTGEYEWDMFNVNLHLHRGKNSGVTIRYGKNLTDIVNILDKSEIYNAIAPYWTDGENTVILPEVYLAVAGATDIICVPVDLTGDFEEKPSVSDLRSDANIYLSNINPTLANSNITIDFEALWQTTEYEDVAVLQQIGLCDTVSIYFPAIGVTQASAKAIKVVYDSLRDKYKSIEFGDAQTTLAESILGKGASSLGDLSDGKIIGASIITAALIKAARETIGELTLTDTLGGPNIYFDIDTYGTEGLISNNGFWFSRGPYKETIGGILTTLVEQRTLEGHPARLCIDFYPEKDGDPYGGKTIAGFETTKDHYDSDWLAYEEAYGRLIISRAKVDTDNDVTVQVDKVIIDSENGAKMELYGSEINADVLTKIIPRKWQQFFSGSSVAVEIGNSGTKSYMILKNSSGTACVTLDTSTGAAFAIPVTATAGLTVSGGLSTDTLTTSGNASVGGDLTVTGDVSADDVTVNGALSVTNRRSAILSNVAAGWHRVLEFSPTTVAHRLGRAGIIVDFDITRFGTTNETHHVSLSLIETDAKFYGEFSNSNTQLIDKIRYTYDSSKGYVDIHLSTSWSANVAVDYQVSASAGSFLRLITTKSLAAVADTPTGETVFTEYALNANGAGDITYNGDVTVGGVLDVTNRRAVAQLSTAGWYRVLMYAGTSTYQPDGATGALIRFNVVVWGNTSANGNHQIDLSTAYGTGHREFVNEFSNGQDTLIDKIRYTKKGNNFYVDVHFTGNSNNLVTVYFDPYIHAGFQDNITSEGLDAVADAPDGETVVTTYTFSQTGAHFGNVFSNGLQLFGLLSGGTAITSNANLNNYTDPGVYTCTTTVAATLSNSSFTTVGFKMIVMDNGTGTTERWQICLASYSNCIIAVRWRNSSGTWQAWKRLTPA